MRRIYAPRGAFCGRSRACRVRRVLVMGILELRWRARSGTEAPSARRGLFETGDVEGVSSFLVDWISVSLSRLDEGAMWWLLHPMFRTVVSVGWRIRQSSARCGSIRISIRIVAYI